MTRGIFDPTGPGTERSGSTFTGPDAEQVSHLPTADEDVETEEQAGGNEAFPATHEAAARNLEHVEADEEVSTDDEDLD